MCHFGGLNAQAPTSHLQPSPGSSAHLARSERNASQLSLLLRRYRARSRLDTSSSALTRDAALRELRTHRPIHSRRRLNSRSRLFAHHVLCRQVVAAQRSRPSARCSVFASGPIHEVFGLYCRGIPKIGCLNCGSSYDHVGQALGTPSGSSLSSGISHHSFTPQRGRGKVPCLALRAP